MLGPTIAHATAPVVSSCLAGVLSSLIFVHVAVAAIEANFWRMHLPLFEGILPLWLFAVPMLAGLFGGFLGARLMQKWGVRRITGR